MPLGAVGIPFVPSQPIIPAQIQTAVTSSPSSSNLPDGWVRKISKTFQREYFECPATGEKSWTPPVVTKPKESEVKASTNARAPSSATKSQNNTGKFSSDVRPATPSKESEISLNKTKDLKDGALDVLDFIKTQNSALLQKIALLERENDALKSKSSSLEDDLKRSTAKCESLQREKELLHEKLTSIMFDMEQEKHAMLAQVEAQQESITTLHKELKHIATDVAVISPAIQHLAIVRDEHKPPAFPQEASPQQ